MLDKVYPTTIPRNDGGYLRQLDIATQYLAFIKQGAQQYGIDVPVLGGLGSRESNWGLPCYARRWQPITAARANVLKAIRNGLDVDFYTAHRDYSKDVLNRAGFFQLNGWE